MVAKKPLFFLSKVYKNYIANSILVIFFFLNVNKKRRKFLFFLNKKSRKIPGNLADPIRDGNPGFTLRDPGLSGTGSGAPPNPVGHGHRLEPGRFGP